MRYVLLALLLAACSGPPDGEGEAPCEDEDEDGACAEVDCCDSDPTTHPGADFADSPDACGSWDRDCSGDVEPGGGLSTCVPGQFGTSYETCYTMATVPIGVANGGWVGAVPECGGTGQLSGSCVFYGGEEGCIEVTPPPGQAVQPCR